MKFLIYIDPGIGSMAVQVIVGAIAACSAALYMFRQKITKFFEQLKESGQKKNKNESTDDKKDE